MISTVIFDLDDTLYDEVFYCRSGLKVVSEFLSNQAGACSSEQIWDCFWKHFSSGNRDKIFDTALEELGISYDDELIHKLVQIYRNHIPIIKLPPDSREILEALRGKYHLGLLTDGFLPAQSHKVQSLVLEDYFEYIVYTEELGREFWKPSPAGFKKVMEHFQVNPGNTVYVADNPEKDFIAPHNLGIKTVQVLRPARIRKDEQRQGGIPAQYVIEELWELLPILEEL